MNGNSVYGLVVCGGKSSRMGTDKSLLTYHGRPQRYLLYDLLGDLCEKVFISCNQEQKDEIPGSYSLIPDDPSYGDIGPMAALLSAFEHYPSSAFLALGCDYPLLIKQDLQALLKAYEASRNTTAYYNNTTGFYEPLLSVYHINIIPDLNKLYQSGNYSLNRLLSEIKADKIMSGSPERLTSIDTPEAYNDALHMLRKTSGNL